MALDAIYSTLEGAITGGLGGAYSGVMGMVSGPLQTAMAINLIIVGFAVMRGVSQEPFGNYLATWLKCYLVILAATGSIAPQIAAAAQNLPDQLAAALGGGGLATSFDTFVANAINPAQAIHNAMEPWEFDLGITSFTTPNLVTYAVLIIMMIVAYIIAAIAMTMVLFIKFGLYVTIAVFPIFVGALIFPSSSGLFFSWVGAALNYAIQTAAVTLALVFVVTLVSTIPGEVAPGGVSTTLAAVEAMILQICAILVGGFLILQAQSIGQFAGGGGSSGAGLLSAVFPSTMARKIAQGNFGLNSARRGVGRAGSFMAANRERMWSQTSGRRTMLTGASTTSNR